MEDPKAKLLTRIKESTNVLVTVSNNPSLDQLSGAIGLTLLLNKLGKHATAVFSGEIPSIIEYLKPKETIEKTTDSLRDFIVALDKSKADKLRYKVEDKMVKIFITPFRSSITEKDLEFSQGDFNVDVVVAVGVHEQKDLDQAITSHGRILHDATVSSINNQTAGNLGTINWVDPKASSLCEMLFDLANELQPNALDPQMATTLLTGIVSETKRFSNERTTARSMAISSQLVAAGANQQLVAAKLQEVAPKPPEPRANKPAGKKTDLPHMTTELPKKSDSVFRPAPKVADEPENEGTLDISHTELPVDEVEDYEQIKIDDKGILYRPTDETTPSAPDDTGHQRIVTEPPALGGKLTANSEPEASSPALDPLAGAKGSSPLLSHDSGPAQEEVPTLPMPQPATQTAPSLDSTTDTDTLNDLEKAVDSPHVGTIPEPDLNVARGAVQSAVSSVPDTSLPARFDLNAQPGLELNPPTPMTPPGSPFVTKAPPTDNTAPPVSDPTAPPPVPPPMMPPGRFLTGTDNSKKDDNDFLAPL